MFGIFSDNALDERQVFCIVVGTKQLASLGENRHGRNE
jgi:hypothetical protein